MEMKIYIETDNKGKVKYYFYLSNIQMGRLSIKRLNRFKELYPHCFVKSEKVSKNISLWRIG